MRQTGFSLVAIMVGIAIGMIGMVFIVQIVTSSSASRNTTMSGSDAQITGALALHALVRDLRPAGQGFSVASAMGCTVNAFDTKRPGNTFTFTLAPIVITQGIGGLPDTLVSLWGSSDILVVSRSFSSSAATQKRLQNRAGVRAGDRVIVIGPGQVCALAEISATSNVDGVSVDHAPGSYVSAAGTTVTARYNAATPATSFTGGDLFDLGAAPQRNVWSIRNNKTLVVSNELAYTDADSNNLNDWREIGDGIIDLQAEYGIDANNNNRIDATEWTTTAPTDWARVLAVRVALLVRSGQYEKTAVTAIAPSWWGGAFVMRNVDGSTNTNPADDNNWRNYRYRVQQAVVPLRNQLWATAP
jgi:type IV pilus assembly protein PilW